MGFRRVDLDTLGGQVLFGVVLQLVQELGMELAKAGDIIIAPRPVWLNPLQGGAIRRPLEKIPPCAARYKQGGLNLRIVMRLLGQRLERNWLLSIPQAIGTLDL